jgi:hypothetical protein
MFHHLERSDKQGMLREVRRVLRDGGSLHLVDFDGGDSARHGSHLPGLHSHRRLSDNTDSTILAMMTEAGLTAVRTHRRTLWGGIARITHYRAERRLA